MHETVRDGLCLRLYTVREYVDERDRWWLGRVTLTSSAQPSGPVFRLSRRELWANELHSDLNTTPLRRTQIEIFFYKSLNPVGCLGPVDLVQSKLVS